MNPVIVIPSYWAETDRFGNFGELGAYDYATPVTKPLPELESCLSSLDRVRGVLRVVVLLVADRSCAASARARVTTICRSHPNLNPLVVGRREAGHVMRAVSLVAPGLEPEVVSLRGYGAIKNMGLVVAAALGHDVVVFMDDDNAACDANFLVDAVWGLGALTRQDLPVLAKTGYFVSDDGDPFRDEGRVPWADRLWDRREAQNEVLAKGLSSSKRLVRSTVMSGGCCAIHARAFCRVPFDPFITRGEDLDYLLDLRASGLDVWLDADWCARARRGEDPQARRASRFSQDVYRWTYENRKLAAMAGRRDLRTVSPSSLEPYPGPWVSDGVFDRMRRTAARHVLAGPDRRAYLRMRMRGMAEARAWADEAAGSYLSFAQTWPLVMDALWGEPYLSQMLRRTGEVVRDDAMPDDGPDGGGGGADALEEPAPASQEGAGRAAGPGHGTSLPRGGDA